MTTLPRATSYASGQPKRGAGDSGAGSRIQTWSSNSQVSLVGPANGSPPNITMTPGDQWKAKPNDSTGRGPGPVTSRTQSEPVHAQVSVRVALRPPQSLEPPCITMRCRNRSVAKPHDQRAAGTCAGASR